MGFNLRVEHIGLFFVGYSEWNYTVKLIRIVQYESHA